MKTILALAVAAAGAFALQDRERPVTSEERTRFLFHAIYEGLIEDGAQHASVKAILDKRNEWFIARCPICDSVFTAFQAYYVYSENHGWKTDRTDGLPDWFGSGWSRETVADLGDSDVKRRHATLKGIVEKYVARRFETIRMTAARRDRMQESLKIGMKEGLGFLKESGGEELFPSSCPSCEGAN